MTWQETLAEEISRPHEFVEDALSDTLNTLIKELNQIECMKFVAYLKHYWTEEMAIQALVKIQKTTFRQTYEKVQQAVKSVFKRSNYQPNTPKMKDIETTPEVREYMEAKKAFNDAIRAAVETRGAEKQARDRFKKAQEAFLASGKELLTNDSYSIVCQELATQGSNVHTAKQIVKV